MEFRKKLRGENSAEGGSRRPVRNSRNGNDFFASLLIASANTLRPQRPTTVGFSTQASTGLVSTVELLTPEPGSHGLGHLA